MSNQGPQTTLRVPFADLARRRVRFSFGGGVSDAAVEAHLQWREINGRVFVDLRDTIAHLHKMGFGKAADHLETFKPISDESGGGDRLLNALADAIEHGCKVAKAHMDGRSWSYAKAAADVVDDLAMTYLAVVAGDDEHE